MCLATNAICSGLPNLKSLRYFSLSHSTSVIRAMRQYLLWPLCGFISLLLLSYLYHHQLAQDWGNIPERFIPGQNNVSVLASNATMYTRRHNVTVALTGRLGNQIFQYIGMLGVAKRNNLSVVLPEGATKSGVSSTFSLTSWPRVSWADIKQNYTLFKEFWGVGHYDARLENLTQMHRWKDHNVLLSGYFQSFKYFSGIEELMKKELHFLPSIQDKVGKFLESVKRNGTGSKNLIRVGIHVRRGDFLRQNLQNLGFEVAPKEYFMKAMYHMKKLYSPIQFIISSNDIDWARNHLGNHSAIYGPPEFTAGEDLALLASCDHMIISSGTFGWWAAWLAGGTTVYYDLFPRPNSPVSRHFHKNVYYPPDWIGMK